MKKISRRTFLSTMAAVGAMSALSACGGGSSATSGSTAASSAVSAVTESKNYENVINIATTSKRISTKLDAMWVNRADLNKVTMFRSLLIATPDLEDVSPDLAESYTVSDDKLTYTFVMKENVKWHDGEPVTADDVKWSVEASLKGSLLSGIYSTAFSAIEGYNEFKDGSAAEISGISVDGNTITFKLAKNSATFLKIMGQFAILPKHCLENADLLQLQNDTYWEAPIGNGMFKLKEFNPGNYVVYVPFEDYDGDKPTFDELRLTAVGDFISAIKSGQVDYYNTSNPEDIQQLDQMPFMTKYPVDINYYRYLVCNIADENGVPNEKIADVRVRKALLMAIDRDSIIQSLFQGLGTVTDTGIPSQSSDYAPAEKYEYNVEKAKALLDEAGFDYNQTIKLRYYANDQASANMMEAIAFAWGDLGVKVDVAKFQGDANEELFNIRDFDFSLKAMSAFMCDEYYGEYASSNTNFRKILGGATDFDDLIDQLSETVDATERTAIFKKLQAMEQEKLFKLPIAVFGQDIYINSDKIDIGDTVFGNPLYYYDMKIADWKLK